MNLFHAVKNLQAQIFHDPDMALAALVTLGDISGRGEDIFVEIVTSPDNAFSLGIIVGVSVVEVEARHPDALSSHGGDKLAADDQRRHNQGNALLRQLETFCCHRGFHMNHTVIDRLNSSRETDCFLKEPQIITDQSYVGNLSVPSHTFS